MKLKFKNQAFQAAATAAVCDVFLGQPYHDPNVYTVDPGRAGSHGGTETRSLAGASLPGFEGLSQGRLELGGDEPDVGYKNAEIELLPETMLLNLNAVKDRQNLEHSRLCASASPRENTFYPALPELEVEMETGTGKTFVYINTIFELTSATGGRSSSSSCRASPFAKA